MPKKKGPATFKTLSEKTPEEAMNILVFGPLGNSAATLAVYNVWKYRFHGEDDGGQDEVAVTCRNVERTHEDILGALLVKAVKEENIPAIEEIIDALRHCMSHSEGDAGVRLYEKWRALAFDYFERRGGENAKPPVTSKDVRDYLDKTLGVNPETGGISQGVVYRFFKEELGITLARAKSGPKN